MPAKATIIRAEEELSTSTMLLEGWMCRYKDLTNGQRQITELHVAGDFVDLHSFRLKRLDHNIMALTPCVMGVVPHSRLREMSESQPHLMRLYWLMTNIDAAIHHEWEVCLGRRPAIARLAHMVCELRARLELVGLTDGLRYSFPLTQLELAECTTHARSRQPDAEGTARKAHRRNPPRNGQDSRSSRARGGRRL